MAAADFLADKQKPRIGRQAFGRHSARETKGEIDLTGSKRFAQGFLGDVDL
jgi:hypothetical protein